MPSRRPDSGLAEGVLHNVRGIMAATALSHVYPLGTRVNERGRLEVGGCDVVELAERFGTPAYIYAEDDMRARARAYTGGVRLPHRRLRGHLRVEGAPDHGRATASCTRRGCRSTSRRAASSTWRWRPASIRKRIFMHGNNKTEAELRLAFDAGIGYLVLDSFAEIELAERLLGPAPQDVLIRVTPGIKPSTHSYIQTGQLDSKFGFGLADGLADGGGASRARQHAPAAWSGCTPTSARRSSSSSPTSRRSSCWPTSSTSSAGC